MNQVSPFTLDFIKGLEGYTPNPKWDYKQHSIGYGTRWNPGDPIGTREDHEAALGREAGKVRQWLDQNVTTQMQPNQRAALVSAGYNLGTGESGLGRLLDDINSGDWESVAQRLPTFNKAGGKVNEGLINRRAKEVEMLRGGNPSALSRVIGASAAAPGGGPIPVAPEALAPPTGRNSKLGEMLLAQAAGAKPRNWGGLLNAGGDLALGYTLSNRAEEAQKEYKSKLSELLSGAGDRESLIGAMMQSGDPALIQTAIGEKLKTQQPQKPQVGRFKALDGGGVLDTATGEFAVPPPSGGQADSAGLSPVAEKEKQKALGKAQGEAAANLPVALQSGEALVSGIDDLLKDPKLPSMTGPFDSWLPNLSGNAARVQSKLDKVQGQTFLQAYEKLKGGGVITEIEGQKAEQALNRLQSLDQNDDDYVNALTEFRNEVATLYDIAQERAGVSPEERKSIPPLPGIETPQQGDGGQSTGAPPAPAVEFLRSNPTPEIIQQFDAKYGAGAAQSILQGQPSPQPQPQPAPQPYDFGVSP